MDSVRKHRKERKLPGISAACALARLQAEMLLLVLVAILALMFSSCGGGSSATTSQADPQMSGNWQFTLTPTGTSSFTASAPGGFLVQKNGNLSGQLTLSILTTNVCNSGTATVTGTVNGQTVSVTAVIPTFEKDGTTATTQTLTLSGGQLSSDGLKIRGGTYTITAGWGSVNGTLVQCGSASDTGTWSATLVPPLTGGFQGFFHSTTGNNVSYANQNVSVSGTFTQGPNTGASSATVTGTILFQDPVSLLNDYPCMTTGSVNGTISGNNVFLQVFSTNGTVIGQIGDAPGFPNPPNPPAPVTLDPVQGGSVLHNVGKTYGYSITTKSCSGTPGDSGNLCMALGSSKACSQPITLTPPSLTFSPQLLGTSASSQSLILTNNSTSPLSGSISLREIDTINFYSPGGDFNGQLSFSEQDNCTQQGSISLEPGKSCTITISFAPQQSCPWLPLNLGGSLQNFQWYPPGQCPLPINGSLTVTVPSADMGSGNDDTDNQFSVPLNGTGNSHIVPSVQEIDFGAEALGEASEPQWVTFTNQSSSPVTILPWQDCKYTPVTAIPPVQPRPPLSSSNVPLLSGIQIAQTGGISTPFQTYPVSFLVPAPTLGFFCDVDPPPSHHGSGLPDFQIAEPDECAGPTGHTLAPYGQPGDSCTIQITYSPQPVTWTNAHGVLDSFLQLNTNWCGDANNPAEPDCEIDSGRFPIEIKTNAPSSLRMFPSAGMHFGSVLKGTASAPLTITLFNDPVDPLADTVTFTSKLVTGADYLETDNCPASLPVNQSCTINVTFTPSVVGLDSGKFTIVYNTTTANQLTQTIYLYGMGQ